MKTPYYIVYEDKLRANLELISNVARQSGANIIMAFKANALWKSFPIVKDYVANCTASSLNELRLGHECLGGEIHSYSPAYTDDNIDEFLAKSTHITFNSLSQLKRYAHKATEAGVSIGLRVNPQCSVIETDLYNPALREPFRRHCRQTALIATPRRRPSFPCSVRIDFIRSGKSYHGFRRTVRALVATAQMGQYGRRTFDDPQRL